MHASRMKRNSGSRNPCSMERKVGRQREITGRGRDPRDESTRSRSILSCLFAFS